jgi:16S rRNA (guanine527-N7)-methyltransferase
MPNAERSDADSILARVPGITARIDCDSLRLFVEELISWNPRIGLVSKRDTANVLVRLITKSVELWDLLVERVPEVMLRDGLAVVDIGSGGGFPGVIWKLLTPEISITLVERKEKKAFFLERSTALLGLRSLRVIQRDARDLVRDPEAVESFDVAVMMAVAPPEQLGDTVEGLLRPGGVFLAPRAEGETVFPGTIGRNMGIHSADMGPEGPALIYIKLPDQPA